MRLDDAATKTEGTPPMLPESAQPAQLWDDWSHWAGSGRGRPRQLDLEQQCIPSAWQATRTAVMICEEFAGQFLWMGLEPVLLGDGLQRS